MFEKIKKWWEGVKRMFTVQTIQKIAGEEIALTSELLVKIEAWNDMLMGNAPWCKVK